MQAGTTVSTDLPNEPHNEDYEGFLAALEEQFVTATKSASFLFTVEPRTFPAAKDLFTAFLDALPASRRQHYTCNTCRRFVNRFGPLVTIDEHGHATPVLWSMEPSKVPAFFRGAVAAMRQAVATGPVTGVFLCEDMPTWGIPGNESKKPPYAWRHMAVRAPIDLVFAPKPLVTADQTAAMVLEERKMLERGLGEFPLPIVKQAHALLTTGNLYRSEKCIGVAAWLLALHEARAATKNQRALDNMLWRAAAAAPTGYCHVRSSMIGTLLEDVAAALPFDAIKRRFDEKMNPLQYQRPTVAPSAGNIEQAERVVEKLGISESLKRRFAKLDEIPTLWKPAEPTNGSPKPSGVFGHLKQKAEQVVTTITQPAVTMTWDKFARTVLHDAAKIVFPVPHRMGNYGALVTAQNPSAPPILQWDRPEKRNPVSWYIYTEGSAPERWNLEPGSRVEVTAIVRSPTMWDEERPFVHQGDRVFLILRGCHDAQYEHGAGLFPETLRSELHGIRATVEAYAKTAVVEGAKEATACGLMLQKGKTWNVIVEVTTKAGVTQAYQLDRWD